MKYDTERGLHYVEIPYLGGDYEQPMIALKRDVECLACQCGAGPEASHYYGDPPGAVWSTLLRRPIDDWALQRGW